MRAPRTARPLAAAPPIPLALLATVGAVAIGCVAAPRALSSGPRASVAPAPTARPAPPALALPARVRVALSGVRGAGTLRCVDGAGAARVVRAEGRAVRVGDAAPLPAVTLPGPVTIGEALHPGDVELTPSADGLRAVASLELEDYVAAVVAAELPIWSAEPAELEAQAIAARTFAVRGLRERAAAGEPGVLTDGVLDQAYRGAYTGAGSAGAARARDRLEAAVRATAGVVLVRDGDLEHARYHASCGGHTADFADVFADEVVPGGRRGPLGVRCAPCAARAAAEARAKAPDGARPLGWVVDLDRAALERAGRAFGFDGPLERVTPARRDRAGRWIEVTLAGPGAAPRAVPFDDLRAALGYGVLPGSMIVTTLPRPGRPIGARLRVQGRGRGHGVGLCQEALRDLARAGWSAERILRHHYPGAGLERLPASTP